MRGDTPNDSVRGYAAKGSHPPLFGVSIKKRNIKRDRVCNTLVSVLGVFVAGGWDLNPTLSGDSD